MKLKFTVLATTLLAPTLALAHSGHEPNSFMSGLTHPVTGIDHLIMLFAFGLLVGSIPLSKLKKTSLIAIALASLVTGLGIGQVFGFLWLVEPMIVASLFVVSLALWQVFSPTTQRIPLALSSSIALLFFHGYAHGVEAAVNLAQFGAGMLLSAMGIMLFGAFVGRIVYSKWLSVGIASLSAIFLLAA